MYKNRTTGYYEHDFRSKTMGRYHASYGVSSKKEADRLHAVAVALVRSRDANTWAALKAGAVTWEQLAELRDSGKPFSAAREATAEPWERLDDAIDLYIKALSANENKSDGTARTAATQLNRFEAYIGRDVRIDRITSGQLTAYQTMLRAEGYASNTITAYVWRVGSLFNWFKRKEEREARESGTSPRALFSPIDHETISTEKTKRTRFLSETEAQRLLAATPRALLFPVAAGLFGGFRVDEMIHLRPSFDVDLTTGTLAVQTQPNWTPKSKRSHRHIPINGFLLPILQDQLDHRSSEEWVTPSFRDPSKPLNVHTFDTHFAAIVERAEMVAGQSDPMGVTYHTLRHTFASWLLMKGADLFTVAQLLGNTVLQCEKTYGHLSKDHRQKAVDLLSGVITAPVFEMGESC